MRYQYKNFLHETKRFNFSIEFVWKDSIAEPDDFINQSEMLIYWGSVDSSRIKPRKMKNSHGSFHKLKFRADIQLYFSPGSNIADFQLCERLLQISF